jgi:hypothetical protein
MKSLLFFIVSFFSVALPRYAACFEVNEITGDMFAAEVIGLHLPSLSNEEFEQLHSYLLTYKVLILRNQSYLSVEVCYFPVVYICRFGLLTNLFALSKSGATGVYKSIWAITNSFGVFLSSSKF